LRSGAIDEMESQAMRRSWAVGAAFVAACASCGSNSARSADQGARETMDGSASAGDEGAAADAGDDGAQGPTDGTAPGEAGLVGTPDAARSDAGAPDGSGFTPEGCMGVDPGNTAPARALPFAIGTPFLGCVKNGMESRYVDFTTPASPAAGGYVVLTFSAVGAIAIDGFVYLASDTSTSIFEMRAEHDGDGLVYWFGAAPSTEYMVSVQDLFKETSLAPYTLTATFTPANDPHKPDDSEALATPIALGSPVQSLAFHGYTSTGGADIGWWSFYQVNLTSAPATVSVTNVPAGIKLGAYLYGNANEGYSSLGFGTSASAGGSVTFTTNEPVLAAPHYVVIQPAGIDPDAYGAGSTPATFVTSPYTLVVTQ
jgi:hypothetical protein